MTLARAAASQRARPALVRALGDLALFARMRRLMDTEVAHVESRARGALSEEDASAVVAFVVGSLVFGAFAPRKAAGFAAPSLRTLVAAFSAVGRRRTPV